MPTPTTRQILNWAHTYIKTWNEGDKDAWLANWRTVMNGDIRMLDPVGTPEKSGWEHCCVEAYDLFQPVVQFRIDPNGLFVNGNELAWFLESHIDSEHGKSTQYSIESYRFNDDGSVFVRSWYRVPSHQNKDLGDAFKVYQPAYEAGI